MYKTFDMKTNDLILNKVALVKPRVEKLSTSELDVIIDALKIEIDSLADEMNTLYMSHYDKIKSDYQAIEGTTMEFVNSVKYVQCIL